MAVVTNLAKSPRGFATVAGHQVFLAPGKTAEIDVPLQHTAHDAWVAAGHVVIVHPEAAPVAPAAPLPELIQEAPHVGKHKQRANAV